MGSMAYRNVLLATLAVATWVLPAQAAGEHIEMRTDYTCDTYAVHFDFIGDPVSGSWKLTRVFKNDALVHTQEFTGTEDILGYYTDTGSLPAEVLYQAKLYRMISGNRTNEITRRELRLSRKATCPTPPPAPYRPATPSPFSSVPASTGRAEPHEGGTAPTLGTLLFGIGAFTGAVWLVPHLERFR